MMDNNEELGLLNTFLIASWHLKDSNQPAESFSEYTGVNNAVAIRILEGLVSDKFISKQQIHETGMRHRTVYQINSSAIDFIDNKVPIEYSGKPYYYHKQLEKEKSEKENRKDEIDLKVKQITISNSKFQKWVPIISAGLAALSLITTIVVSVSKPEKQYIPLQELQQLHQTQENINKSIEQYLDTLRKYH